MKLLVMFLCLTIAFVNAANIGTTCMDDSQCGQGECCQILSEFMVVSKRAAATSGTCQRYRVEGEHCGLFDKMNGYCSCGPGLHCKAVEVPISTRDLQKRKMIPPRPGYTYDIKCVKNE